MFNFRETYRISDEYTRIAIAALFFLTLGGIVLSIFLSGGFVLALLAAAAITWLAFLKPTWALAGLLWYLPFEPFLLKWVPDDIYVYAKYGSEMLVYLLFIAVLWRLISGTIVWRPSPADLPFFLLVLFACASAVINVESPWIAILGMRQIVRFILLFFVTYHLRPSALWLRRVCIGLGVILAIQVVLGASQAAVGGALDSFLLPSESRTFGDIQVGSGTVQFWDPGQRVFGTLGRYDQLGTWMAFLLLLAVAYFYEAKRLAIRSFSEGWWMVVGFLLAIGTLLLTYSRSSWFGFLLGALFIAVWAKRDKRVMLGVGVSCAVIALYLVFSGLVVDRLIDTADQTLAERFFEAFSYERWHGEYTGQGRVYWIYQTLVHVVPASPVFGFGPGSYGGGVVTALHNTKVYDALGLPFGVYGTEGYVDNNWMSLWGELGTVGLGLFTWLYGSLFFACLAVWRQAKKKEVRALALGVCAAMLAVALHAFLATMFEVRTLAPYLWVFAALVLVMRENEETAT